MLSASKLENSLFDFFQDPSFQNTIEAALGWTDAYDGYARDAEDASRDRVAVVNRPGFQSILAAGFNAQAGTAQTMAQFFDNAFVVYWTGGVFAFGIPPTPAAPCPSIGATPTWSVEFSSVVITVVPGVLYSLLLPIFLGVTKATTARQQAQQISTAFHSATTSAVTVLITGLDTTPTPAGPLPIQNVCTVF